MQYTKLGNADLTVSRVCMGCMGFGDAKNGQHSWTVDEAHSREIIRRGLELGVNFFDTAIGYQSGTSEQYLGRALRDFAKRDNVVVATKFLPRTQEEIAAGVTGQQHIQQMVNTSLKNLGMDYVDLYIYHMWDYETPLYDIMDGLNRVVKAGKARYIGISNCFAYQLAKANALAEKEGFAKFVSIQGHYNLIFREEEREMAKLCADTFTLAVMNVRKKFGNNVPIARNAFVKNGCLRMERIRPSIVCKVMPLPDVNVSLRNTARK